MRQRLLNEALKVVSGTSYDNSVQKLFFVFFCVALKRKHTLNLWLSRKPTDFADCHFLIFSVYKQFAGIPALKITFSTCPWVLDFWFYSPGVIVLLFMSSPGGPGLANVYAVFPKFSTAWRRRNCQFFGDSSNNANCLHSCVRDSLAKRLSKACNFILLKDFIDSLLPRPIRKFRGKKLTKLWYHGNSRNQSLKRMSFVSAKWMPCFYAPAMKWGKGI